MSRGSELRKLLRAAERAGVRVSATKSGHFRLDLRNGVTETVGGTPGNSTSDALHRLIRRARAIGRASP